VGKLGLAFKSFFGVFGNAEFAKSVEQLLSGKQLTAETPATPPPTPKPPAPKKPVRSDAVSLLSALQREARLLDFLQESIADYDDAQIGAAVRDIHRDSAAVIQRMFAPAAVVADDEGASLEIPAGYDPAEFRLTGNVAGDPPHQGTLQHHGWKATRCDLPQWTGGEAAVNVIAPAEVEVA